VSGAARIFVYNWPIYASTWLAAVGGFVIARYTSPGVALLLMAAGVGAILWSALSLWVSHYVYDRSPLAQGRWVQALLPERVERWVAIDAGLDAEVVLDGVLPGACLARLDLYDGDVVRAASVRRARATTQRAHVAIAAKATALPLESGSCDLVVVVFSAHEVRLSAHREAFFTELARVLRVGGRALVIEHLRDVMNFVAFGPGFMHFLARREWLRLGEHAALRVAAETRVTPWVMALALEKDA